MMHSALDRLEEILGSPRYFDLVKMQRGSKWLGSLLPMEDCEIYGYVTPSCTKILALVKRDSVIPLEKRREVDLRALFVSMQKTIVSPQQKQLPKFVANSNLCGADKRSRLLRKVHYESFHKDTRENRAALC